MNRLYHQAINHLRSARLFSFSSTHFSSIWHLAIWRLWEICNELAALFFIGLLALTSCSRATQLGMDENHKNSSGGCSSHKCVSYEGHQLTLYQKKGIWIAQVAEKLLFRFGPIV